MTQHPDRIRRVRALALLGGGLAAGVIGATALGASAQDTTSGSGATAAPTGSSSSGTPAAGTPRAGNGEVPVTGTKADQLKAAALKQVPGGTVDGVTTETDNAKAAYEVHVTKADGTHVTVLFDKDLAYVATETGGMGGPHSGHGGPGGMRGGGDETPVTGAKATTLRTAALAKVPGATVEQVSTDSGDAAYEVHLRRSDGTEVTVKFDKNLAYVSTEEGRGK